MVTNCSPCGSRLDTGVRAIQSLPAAKGHRLWFHERVVGSHSFREQRKFRDVCPVGGDPQQQPRHLLRRERALEFRHNPLELLVFRLRIQRGEGIHGELMGANPFGLCEK